MNNWQEWTADTDPTTAASVLRITSITSGPPATVSVQSSSSRLYTLQSCTDLAAPLWLPVPGATDLPGTDGLLILADADPAPAKFYRISVRLP